MTRTSVASAAVVLLALSLHDCHGDAATKNPAFEVASIKPCPPNTPEPPGEHEGTIQFVFPGGRFEADATTVEYLMEWAYDIQRSQHSDTPSWIGTDRFQIVAKAAGDASEEQTKLMARSLLADRFQLKLHHEQKEVNAFVISLGKTAPKLNPPKEGEACSVRIAPRPNTDHGTPGFQVTATRYSLTKLTATFARHLGGVVLLNQTGLNDDFDFTLDLIPDETHPNPLDPSIIVSALREIGLSVKAQKTTVDFLTIDGVEKPSAN